LGRQPIGQAEHGEIGLLGDGCRIRTLDNGVAGQGQEWDQGTPALAAAALAPQKGDRQARVLVEQAQGLQTAVAASAYDRNALACHWGDPWAERTGLYKG